MQGRSFQPFSSNSSSSSSRALSWSAQHSTSLHGSASSSSRRNGTVAVNTAHRDLVGGVQRGLSATLTAAAGAANMVAQAAAVLSVVKRL